MPSKLASYVIGIDVGGTNTDSVILQNKSVLAWHKTPTTSDIQLGVEAAIAAVVQKAAILPSHVDSIRVGTTQFVNAVLEQDTSKLDQVAVVRLCGPYSRGSPPFVNFPPKLRALLEGHFGYVDGGYQVDGTPIAPINPHQLREQASIIKSEGITSIVVVGIYSPSNNAQEEEARKILAAELGPGFDISCSSAIGRLGFLERENAGILNASLRRFARHVIAGFSYAAQKLGKCKLYITLNDGTLSRASEAADYPVKCFSSGPTNSARGAALLARGEGAYDSAGGEILVVDVGGTTTDICAMLDSGYPRQSSAFHKIAGIRTNFTVPDVHSIALGGGSICRVNCDRISVGPDSVGADLEKEGIYFEGKTLTATDLVLSNAFTELIQPSIKTSGLCEISRALEEAIDQVKTKQGDAQVILVGGGSIIVGDQIAGVSKIIAPKYFEVANAVGAAIGKISGTVDKTVVLTERTIDQELEDAKTKAIEDCVAAGGNRKTIEIVEVETVPVSYTTNGATRLFVRVVADLVEGYEESQGSSVSYLEADAYRKPVDLAHLPIEVSDDLSLTSKASSYEIINQVDLRSYQPRIEGDLWYLSELDLQFLQDGTGVLGVGSCGEPYPVYLACLLALRNGGNIIVRRQDTLPDDAVVLVGSFMGSPSVYLERIPGLNEVIDAMQGVMRASGISTFDAVIPNEIGGMNAFEALLAAHRLDKTTLDTDLVARAYPKVWQTVRCLDNVPIVPAAVSDGAGQQEVFPTASDNLEAEDLMRDACTNFGSLSGMCVKPIDGIEAKTLPRNSFSHAWTIGRSIAISRSLKLDPILPLLKSERGILLFTGKIISVTRNVGSGFTRGSVVLSPLTDTASPPHTHEPSTSLLVDFENENLSATLRKPGQPDKTLAICPDLITFLDKANGAPLGISDYKYGLRVSVIALRAPPIWTTERGLEMGGPKAFGLDVVYEGVGFGDYEAPKSVWEMFGE
ncbi:hypothetical protein NA56DRAFT_567411 [Hyaloscypha hepaticicola]|uniref:DUF917-domain-containing protein n=1 Tax=Hyaloscypha hepaticicola TaxID=2082293 RepID=A0A2J6QCS1_9HELO|nr:hypothetical protein NA56DRAFT_567411 [Hyaloscypha hepaticicola]